MYLVKILNADHRPVDVEVSLEIYRVPLQRWRFILHFFYGYSYSEIAKMQDCNKSAVMRSVQSALKKVRKNIAA